MALAVTASASALAPAAAYEERRWVYILRERTNQIQEIRAYSRDVPIRHNRKHGYILRAVQSDTGSTGIFSGAPGRCTRNSSRWPTI
eukprot:3837830-Pyramimonas_sp.AAC.1